MLRSTKSSHRPHGTAVLQRELRCCRGWQAGPLQPTWLPCHALMPQKVPLLQKVARSDCTCLTGLNPLVMPARLCRGRECLSMYLSKVHSQPMGCSRQLPSRRFAVRCEFDGVLEVLIMPCVVSRMSKGGHQCCLFRVSLCMLSIAGGSVRKPMPACHPVVVAATAPLTGALERARCLDPSRTNLDRGGPFRGEALCETVWLR
jgi:hypothetical protein